jgi:hypothetical protein
MEDVMHINRRELIIAGAAGTIAVGTIWCRKSRPTTQLSVLFSGLIGMVPNTGGTAFLLVDGAATLNKEHHPRLLAPIGVISSGIRPTGNDPRDGRPFWDLKNHQVTLTSGANTGTSRADDIRGPDEVEKPKQNSTSHRNVTWVVNMSRIPAAGTGQINPACLAPDPRTAKVASRVQFKDGQVAARFEPPFHGVVWQIGETPSNPFRQALAELTIDKITTSGPVVFRLEPFPSGPDQDIILAPSTGAKLELEIANLTESEHCMSASEGNNLAHFAAFYQLLAVPPSSPPPIPSCQDGNCPGCPSNEVVYCPPADYNP